MDTCEALEELIRHQFIEGTTVRTLKSGKCLLQIPFYDADGDPIRIVVHKDQDSFILNDAGAIVGNLFTLGQHTQDTPAFKLLGSLVKAYGLNIDFDRGLITTTIIDERQIGDAIAEGLDNNIPHIDGFFQHISMGFQDLIIDRSNIDL